MKTLYISDLDGTLLNKSAELSEYTINALNILIDKGLLFSVATARTAATCNMMLAPLRLKLPVILMNGVLVYDTARKSYIKKEVLSKEKALQIISAMRESEQGGLMYGLKGEKLVTYYEIIYNDAVREFIDERITKYNKQFIKIDDFTQTDADIIYFCFMDTYERIHRLYDMLTAIGGIRIEKYRDIYSDNDLWYMEVFTATASKLNAVKYLRKAYGFDKIVAFGDNLNDLPLFEASDESFAVENAVDAIKERASGTIGANTADGVARWLEENALFN